MEITNKTNFKSSKTFKLLLLLIIQYSLFISNCYSQFWTEQSSGITNSINSISSVDTNTGWFASWPGVVKKTTNGGNNWFSQSGPFNLTIYCIHCLDANRVFACGANNRTYYTIDGGNTWYQNNPGWSGSSYCIFFTDQNTGFVGDGSTLDWGSIRKSTNGGATWSNVYTTYPPGVTYSTFRCIYFINNLTGWLGSYDRIIKTTNGGATWTSYLWNGNKYGLYFINESTGWLAGWGISKTTNGGINWSQQSSGYFNSVKFIKPDLGYAVGENGKIFKTVDGTNWSQQTSGFTGNFKSVSFANANIGWAVGDSGKIYKTSTGGVSPNHDVASGPFINLPSSFVINEPYQIKSFITNLGTYYETSVPVKFFINNNLINTINKNLSNGQVDTVTNSWTPASTGSYTLMYVASSASDTNRINDTVKVTIDVTITNLENNYEIPESFSLSQNYPNPFNPVTNIKYGIPINSFVTLKVYDVMGREVKSLVNEVKSPGNYSVDFNGTELTSGVYFYRLTVHQGGSSTVDFTETKRMMLIK